MKIKLIQAVETYVNIYILGSVVLPVSKRRKIRQIADALEKEKKFYDEEFQELIDKYTVKDKEGWPLAENKEFVFESEDKKAEYISKVIELRNCEIEIDCEKIEFTIAEQEQLNISLVQEEILKNIIDFA